ncbi:hypothetical protein LVJ94_44205 [Pendulispora rubella]|uniref:Glycosyltransferase RgtA/B/C/D-like domain-containing protein n=1 Tax=Pendulispora rubella TaxID=2741070 RepID=A0ABZ2L1P2_9BACT
MSSLQGILGAWGLLPFAAPAMVYIAVRLGSLVFPDDAAHRAVGGAVLAMALVVAIVGLLGAVHVLTTPALVLALLGAVVALAMLHRGRRFAFPYREAMGKEVLPLLIVACGALFAVTLAARWLPVWPWDSMGYHLPYVNFVVMGRGFGDVPSDANFISTYPHVVELFMVALRLLLPDDRLIDLGQVPFGILGAIATSGIARLCNAERQHALAAGCAWLLVPVVFLQLPTNYVDIGSAALLLCAIYFVLAPPSPRSLCVAGIALGLYLGSKPGAPLGTLLLTAVLVARGLHAKRPGATMLAVALLASFGVHSYLGNLLRHGNPLWPVDLRAGPLHLAGIVRVDELLAGGVTSDGSHAPRTHGPLPLRLLQSWTALGSEPALDLRIGGYGPLFLLALPFATATLLAWKVSPETKAAPWSRLAACVGVTATLLAPDPAVARFVLAFPAMVLALAAPYLARIPARPRIVALGAGAVLGGYQLVYAWPGLLGGGPPLRAYASMSDAERAGAVDAVGVDGTSKKFREMRKLVADDETFAFDRGADFPYLCWEPDLRYPVVRIPNALPREGVEAFFERAKVRVFVAGDDTAAGEWARAHPEQAVRLFSSKWGTSAVYERRSPAHSGPQGRLLPNQR